MITVQELIDFEKEIAELYSKGLIKAPVHLRSGNEDQLIELFDRFKIGKDDWICGTWAFHLESLLKGMPKEELKQEILAGRSISINSEKYKILTSPIVGAIGPQAVGLAEAIKYKGGTSKVYGFIGDMGFFHGDIQTSIRYSYNHSLPIQFIITDNSLSVNTPTKSVWKYKDIEKDVNYWPNCTYYKYTNGWPHSGLGYKVLF